METIGPDGAVTLYDAAKYLVLAAPGQRPRCALPRRQSCGLAEL
jgi:hypothetical protein